MKVVDLYKQDEPVYSLEVFPPRNGETMDAVFNTIDNLIGFEPAFISVTGGALGSLRGGTIAIAADIKRKYGIEGIPHFTCVNRSIQDIENLLMEMKFSEIENVFALRGDPALGQKEFTPHPEGHKYASALVEQIKSLNDGEYLMSKDNKDYGGVPTDFGIAVAGYPDGHVELQDKTEDLNNLKLKVDKGADYIVTQLFFDTDVFLEFVDNANHIGIDIPIIPGVMPLDKYGQIKFCSKQMGLEIPKGLNEKLQSHEDDKEAIKNILEEHTMAMCIKLIEQGTPGIQFFTMDKPEGTKKILQELYRGKGMPIHSTSIISSSDFVSLNRALNIVFTGSYGDKKPGEVKTIIDACLKECATKYYKGSVDRLIENELGDLIGAGPVNPEHPYSIYRCVADRMLKFHEKGVYSQVA